MVGLSAAELQAETLFPGDTIEYFSMAFVAGDKRGHRVSKVLRIDRRDEDFPIRVDTQEMMPLTILIKRVRDRNDFEISSDDAKWRKLRTFKLVDGEVEGETRADRLNAGLKQVLSGAREATKKHLAREKAERTNAGSKKIMSKFFTKAVPSTERESDDELSPDSPSPKRKPLTPRENRTPSSKSMHHHRDVSKKRREREKEPSSDRRTHGESNKHTSYKRKRDATPTKPSKRSDKVRHKPRKCSSNFSHEGKEQPRSKPKTNLLKFMNHIEEKKKDRSTSLDEYIELDKQQQKLREEADKSSVDSGKASASKKEWVQHREKFKASKGGSILLWLNGGGNCLEKASAGVSNNRSDNTSGSPYQTQKEKQRTLDLAPDKPKSSKMHRRDLDFKMSENVSNKDHWTNKVAHRSKYHTSQASKHEGRHQKYRSSLGSQSVKPSNKGVTKQEKLNFMNQWNQRR